MAKNEKFNEEDGVWRTIGGRRVFIRTGQSLSDAMKESGKFKSAKKKKKPEQPSEEEKAEKINETMDKREAIIKKLDEETADLDAYDRYNLAVSKLEQSEDMQPTERQYWAGIRDRYVSNEKTREAEIDAKETEPKKLTERDANDVIDMLNDEGSDFTFGEVKIEDGKLITDVGVFMPDERGYVNRELEIPLDKNETFDSLEEKLRDWQDRHSTPDSFDDPDFDEPKKDDIFSPKPEDWEDINHWYNDNPKEEWDKQDNESPKKETKTDSDYRNKITDVAKNSKEDNVTLDVETGKPVNFDKGYSVSFQQSTDNYTDEEYAEKVAECRDKCDGKVYAGKYGGDAEASFHTDNLDDAVELMHKYNQESIYDWQHGTLIMNDKYDASKNQTNYDAGNSSFDMRKYDVQVQHDNGKSTISVVASDEASAKKMVMNSENAPESAILGVKDNGSVLNSGKKTTNEYMNDKIKKGASKNKAKDDLPKKTEIKTQGTSNRKEVSENIQAHILDYYDSPEDFIQQMDAMDYLPTKWHAGEEIAKGGGYMIYYDEQRDFLDSLKINPKGKNFSDDRVFQTYTSLIGRESAKLYDRLKKNEYRKYMKQHPGSKMTFSEYKDMKKGGE